MSEQKDEQETDDSVSGKINGIVEGVLSSLLDLIGPLTPAEENGVRFAVAFEITELLKRRLDNNCFIGKGASE